MTVLPLFADTVVSNDRQLTTDDGVCKERQTEFGLQAQQLSIRYRVPATTPALPWFADNPVHAEHHGCDSRHRKE